MIATGQSFGFMGVTRAIGTAQLRPSPRSFFVFGLGYGVASLACTLPVFLVVVGTSLLGGNVFAAGTHFVTYALGMGTVLTTVIVGAAFFRSAVASATKRIVPYVHGVMAALLLSAGLFIIVYWVEATELLR
jgi:cytochrome c biogenesis protein CcdA